MCPFCFQTAVAVASGSIWAGIGQESWPQKKSNPPPTGETMPSVACQELFITDEAELQFLQFPLHLSETLNKGESR
jgi:hypothetical protein